MKTAINYAAVTPSDTTELGPTLGLFVGAAGTVIVDGQNGAAVTFTVPAGVTLWGEFKRVRAASTATGIVALYA